MGLAWVLWVLTVLSLPVVVWLDQLLRQAGLGELSPLQAANLLWILAGVSAVTVGAVLASRRPSHPVGWLLLVVGLSDQSDGLISNYVHYGVMARPGGLPAAGYKIAPHWHPTDENIIVLQGTLRVELYSLNGREISLADLGPRSVEKSVEAALVLVPASIRLEEMIYHTRLVAQTGVGYDQGTAIGDVVLGSPHARLLDLRPLLRRRARVRGRRRAGERNDRRHRSRPGPAASQAPGRGPRPASL